MSIEETNFTAKSTLGAFQSNYNAFPYYSSIYFSAEIFSNDLFFLLWLTERLCFSPKQSFKYNSIFPVPILRINDFVGECLINGRKTLTVLRLFSVLTDTFYISLRWVIPSGRHVTGPSEGKKIECNYVCSFFVYTWIKWKHLITCLKK